MRTRITLCLATLFVLSGCSAQPEDKDIAAGVNDAAINKGLADSTRAMAESLRVLYEIQNAKTYQNATPEERSEWRKQAYNLPESLKLPVTVNHHGDAEMLIRQIARMARYKVEEPFGDVPHDKPIVKIKAQARPAYDILRDIGSQVRGRLVINIMPAENPTQSVRGIISLEYL